MFSDIKARSRYGIRWRSNLRLPRPAPQASSRPTWKPSFKRNRGKRRRAMSNKRIVIAIFISIVWLCGVQAIGAQDWAQWRGPNRDGVVVDFVGPPNGLKS